MRTVILRTSANLALYLILIFSLFVLFRGHNAPGGGFIGGLLAAAAIVVELLATDLKSVRRMFPVSFPSLTGWGLVLAGLTGLGPMLFGYPFLTAYFDYVQLPLLGRIELSTVLLFDIGIYLVVVGSVLTVVTSVAEEPGAVASPRLTRKRQEEA